MNFWARMHRKPRHCELTSFLTAFTLVASIVSVYIYFFQNQLFGSNLLYLFALSTIAGVIGIIYYRHSMGKPIFPKI